MDRSVLETMSIAELEDLRNRAVKLLSLRKEAQSKQLQKDIARRAKEAGLTEQEMAQLFGV